MHADRPVTVAPAATSVNRRNKRNHARRVLSGKRRIRCYRRAGRISPSCATEATRVPSEAEELAEREAAATGGHR